MASEGEDNKLLCITNVNNDQDTNFINVYKSLEHILNNKHELFTNKVESLIEVWKQVCVYSLSDKIPYVVQLMDWAKLHTLNIVLTGEWKIHKDTYEAKLLNEVERTESVLHNLNNIFSLRCKKLAEVIRDPWGNPILNRLLNSAEPNIGPEEIEFFSMETGYFVSMRLKKLCESQCEDLALNLVAAFMRCYKMAETQQFNLNTTEKQRWFIFDVYVALLFKYKKMPLILSTLKSLDLKDGLDLVKRFNNKRVKISKVWRHCTKIAQLATQVYITAAIMKPISESCDILGELLKIWFSQYESDPNPDNLMVAIRRIIQAADSAVHLYIFCDAIHQKFGSKLKTFTIELYIRALTTDMNDLEREKNENDTEKVAETTKRLADGFCRLADVLEEHIKVSRECVLTSFSLQPTSERLKKIEECARRCGYEVLDTGQEWKCKLHPPVLPSDELCWICNTCGEYMSQPQLEIPLNTNTALSEALTAEHLGLSPQLCDDLAVILSSPRYQILSWLHQWDNLHRLCVMYLNDPERTKNLVTELKFVDIDYSVFMSMKREPLDENELTGIERGYEHFLENDFFGDDQLSPLSEDSESQDSRPYSLGSDGAGDSINTFLPTSNTKSDPNVLKSLRMFRPNLKRARASQSGETIPPKVFIGDQGVYTQPSVPPRNQLSTMSNNCSLPHTATSLATNMGSPVDNRLPSSNHYTPISGKEALRNYLAGNYSYRTQEFLKSINKYSTMNANTYLHSYNPNHQTSAITSSTNNIAESKSRHIMKQETLEPIRTSGEFLNLKKDGPINYCNKIVERPQDKTRLHGISLLYRNKLLEEKERRINKQKFKSFQKFNQKTKTLTDKLKKDTKTDGARNSLTKELQLAYLEKKRNSLIDSLFRNVDNKNDCRSTSSSATSTPEPVDRDSITITSLLSSNKNSSSDYSSINSNLKTYHKTHTYAHNNVVKCENTKIPSSHSYLNTQSVVKSSTAKSKMSSVEDACKTNPNPTSSHKKPKEEQENFDIQSTNFNDVLEKLLKSKIDEMALDIKNTSEFLKENIGINNRYSKNEVCHRTYKTSSQVSTNNKVVDIKKVHEITPSKVVVQSIETPSKLNADDRVKIPFTVCNPSDNEIVTSSGTVSLQRIEQKNTLDNDSSSFLVPDLQQTSKDLMDRSGFELLRKLRPEKSQNKIENEHNKSTNMQVGNQLKVADVKKLTDEKPKKAQFFLCEEEQIITDDINNVKNLSIDEEIHFLGDGNEEGTNVTVGVNVKNDENKPSKQNIRKEKERNSSLILGKLLSEPNFNADYNIKNSDAIKDVFDEKNDQCTQRPLAKKRGRPKKINQEMKEVLLIEELSGEENKETQQNKEIATTQGNKIEPIKKINKITNERYGLVKNGKAPKVRRKRRRPKKIENLASKKTDMRKTGRSRRCSKTEDEMNTASINNVINGHSEEIKETNDLESKENAILKEPRVILERIDLKNYEKLSNHGKTHQEKNSSKKEHDMIPLVILNRDEVKMKMNIKGDAHLGSKGVRVNNSKEIAHLKVPFVITEKIDVNINNVPEKIVQSTKVLNPCVVLKRIDVGKKRDAKSVLANVPGLNDLELIRPSPVNHIVQVVQVAGGRSASNNVTNQNTQTSTQVTPHIQRIGQPRVDKPEQTTNSESTSGSTTSVTSATTSTKPPTTQPSTLINILSQQIIRPGQSNNNNNCIRSRTSPLINILSQQIIRPPTSSVLQTSKSTSETTSSDLQGSNTSKISTTEQTVSQLSSPLRNSTAAVKTVVSSPSSDQNRIVQFICKSSDGKLIPVTSFTSNRVVKVSTPQTVTSTSPDNSSNYDENFSKFVQVASKNKNEIENPETLPKFQQAFGKSVYNNVDSSDTNSVNSESIITNSNSDLEKKVQPKNSTSVNIQPIQGGVIYTRQMPVGQTINLIPPGRGQVFRIASSNTEQISLVKDTVIHSKMSALLAAALQGKKNSDGNDAEIISTDNTTQTGTRVTVTRPTLVQNARIVKPVIHIPSNVIRNSPQPNLSSTTLEQLREFDMVYKQVKERSSTTTSVESVTTPESTESSQRISVTYLNQGQKFTQLSPVVVVSSYCNLQPAASPALSVTSQGSSSPCVTPAPTPTLPKTSSSKSSKGKSVKSTTTHTSKASPIPKPQQKPQEDEHTTQRIFDILAEYAEQLRNSPDLNNKPAPRRRSNPPTNPSQNSKRKKNSSSKKTGQCSSTLTSEADLDDPRTVGSEDSSCGVVQISMQEDEQPSMTSTTSESNDVPVTSRQQLILTDASHNQARNLIIADSSVGEALKMPNTAVLVPGNYIMPVSMVKGGQQIAVVSGGSKILATVPARSGPNMLLFQSFLNQTRKSGVPTVKYSTIQPISGISSQSLAGVSAQPPVILPPTSHGLTAVTLGQPITLKKLDESENRELLLTISQTQDNSCTSTETVQQPDSSTNNTTLENSNKTEECAIKADNASEEVFSYKKNLISGPIATPVIAQAACIKEDSVVEHSTTAAQTIMTLNLNSQETIKRDDTKVEERVQSVLVTACTSNGPMLAHSPPQYRKPSETSCSCTDSTAKEFLRNGGKQNNNEQKHFQGNTVFYQNKTKKVQTGGQRLDRELHQLCLQRKQAALERELRLQKSLSEECEDLGVDEPSTSDLFPEADLLFDSNHSPSFDQSSQDLIKRSAVVQDGKEENKQSMTLFSDDDNSGSLKTEFLFEPVEYQPSATELEYDRTHQLTNGQRTTSNESGSSGEDNTLLQNCASMSDVTLNSPISPDPYADNTPPSLNKYKYKYSNRKKNDRQKSAETWPTEVSSSEDTTGSTELGKSSSHSPELCTNKRTHSLSCDDELSDGSFKVVRVAISKTDFLKEDESCEELHCEEDADCSLSGRGARRSVKKLCSCCNGSQDAAAAASRKRPNSGPHTPTPHKKAFLTKKR